MAESANSSSVDTIAQVLWSRLLFSIRSGFESPLNRVAIYAGRIIWRDNILARQYSGVCGDGCCKAEVKGVRQKHQCARRKDEAHSIKDKAEIFHQLLARLELLIIENKTARNTSFLRQTFLHDCLSQNIYESVALLKLKIATHLGARYEVINL